MPGVGHQTILPEGVTIGRHSYGHDERTFQIFMRGARIEVGAFCSIGPEVRILAGSEHIATRATTFPLNALLFDPAAGNALDAIDRGTTVVGNDVWIGLGAIVLSGVAIGDGAMIGAGAVVSKSVPSYAVAVGNPAHTIRYRFVDETCRRLLALRWWEWSDEEITALKPLFMADMDSFLAEAERVHGFRSESDLSRRLREMPSELLTPHRRGVKGSEHAPSDTTENRVGDLEAQILEMRSTTAWRWATRYWRMRDRLARNRCSDGRG